MGWKACFESRTDLLSLGRVWDLRSVDILDCSLMVVVIFGYWMLYMHRWLLMYGV
jgi:hypothetical protein